MSGPPLPIIQFLPHLCFILAPWFLAIGVSWAITLLGLMYLILVCRRNWLPLLFAGGIVVLFLAKSQYLFPLGAVTLSAILVSVHVSLILVGPFLRVNLTTARNNWVLHVSYMLFFALVVLVPDAFPKAAFQISLFTYVSYVSLYGRSLKKALRDFWLLMLLLLGSARSILGGFIFGRIAGMFSADSLRAFTYLVILAVCALAVIYREAIFGLLTMGYEGLKAAGYLLKGRTVFALALLKSADVVEMFGKGAGYTATVMRGSFDSQVQLHNEWLRTLFDYGLVGFLAIFSILARHLMLASTGFVIVAMFITFMLTGNALSYATVIFPVVLALARSVEDRASGKAFEVNGSENRVV